MSTKELPIATGYPHPCGCQVQIPYCALGPAVSCGDFFSATMTDGMKSFVGFCMDSSLAGIGKKRLFYNFDSTKGKVWCYSGYGHRRPPLDNVYLGRQTYIHRDTGCPFYLNSRDFPSISFN